MSKFDLCVYYTENEYGKAWTTVEADTEEEARAILQKSFDDNEEHDLDWDYYDKGGDGTVFEPCAGITCVQQRNNNV